MSSPAIPPEEAFEGQLLNAEKSSIAPIPFPAFDENRRLIVEWVEGLNYGRNKALLPSMAATLASLNRVRGSSRHERLAEFVHHATLAVGADECEGARHILLTALATFGWPSRFGEQL